MQLGFVSAILGDLGLEDVLVFAGSQGFACVEVMCWPPGGADRRYAGVSHLDVSRFSEAEARHVLALCDKAGVAMSALGYYPNPLHPNPEQRRFVVEHLKKVIRAAPLLGVKTVTTFIGRDKSQSIQENWRALLEVWPDILATAARERVQIAIENCPMLFSQDEWPGGTNLAVSPAVWRALFAEFRVRPQLRSVAPRLAAHRLCPSRS